MGSVLASYLLAGGAWSVSLHCPAHWLAGRVAGIRFTSYFFGGPFPPRPGLKTDYATYLRADPAARAWMHASGAIVTAATRPASASRRKSEKTTSAAAGAVPAR